MDYIDKLIEFRERQDQILEIYEAGVSVQTIMKELGISKARVYQIIDKAKARREKKEKSTEKSEGQTLGTDE